MQDVRLQKKYLINLVMLKDIPTLYETQLPKLERFKFDRIFGYITGLASISGLVAAPLVVQNQDTLSYLYMGFLSFLVILLIVHAVLVEKRKLHRYAQTVFHTHFVQHLIRDSLSELKNTHADSMEGTTQEILNAIATSFSITSGKTCRASIIELNDKFELTVAARNSMSKIRVTPRTHKHYLSENTDFKNLWYCINGCSRYYLNNNIIKSWLEHDYENSSFTEIAEPRSKTFLGFNFIRYWPLNYKSALILPIRYVSDFDPPKDEDILVPHWDYYGFLCIDSISKGSFDERYSPEHGAIYADMLYTYFSQCDFILDTMTTPNKN